MSGRAARGLLAAAAALLLGACATSPRLPEGPPVTADERCEDVDYHGEYRDAEHPEGRRFRMKARVCLSGHVFTEIRGPVGGPGLVAAARPGAARLLFVRERVAIDGPDLPWFWLEWTGAPLSGAMLVDLLRGRGLDPRPLEGWRVRGSGEGAFPPRLVIEGPEGIRVELERRARESASGGAPWPAVPASFEHRREGSP